MQNLNRPKSLIFAPMEGITDQGHRLAIAKLYPEWDYYYTDFLRASGSGKFPTRTIIDHIGKSVLEDPELMEKTVFQILATANSRTIELVEQISELNVKKIDLNLGCPSKTVNSHGGGSYLLDNPEQLKKVVGEIRNHFVGTFTVKMRIGYRDDQLFERNLKTLEDLGVESITLHARTRDQLYKGIADWDYIAKAVKLCQVPIIGNGDIWNVEDIDRVYEKTGCHGVMCARGALKTPWLARLYKRSQEVSVALTPDELLEIRRQEIVSYYYKLKEIYLDFYQGEDGPQKMLKRFKSLCRYIFDDFPQGDKIKSYFLRCQELPLFEEALSSQLQ